MAHTHHLPHCTDPRTCWCETKRYLYVFGIALAILVGEVIGGIYSGSIALLTDAGHVLADNAAIIVSIAVSILVRYGHHEKSVRTYGFVLNSALLGLLIILVYFAATRRLMVPQPVDVAVMIPVAIVGGLGNVLQHRLLHHGHAHNTQTGSILSLHILFDLWMSVGVVLGGVCMWLFAWWWVDPLLSIALATVILWQIAMLQRRKPSTHQHHH